MDFVGKSLPLTQEFFDHVVSELEIEPAALWAVLKVETSGCGFYADRRPLVLFERHLFHQATGGRFPASDINSLEPGGYAKGEAEYDRLARAILLDRDAALSSTSWGLGQVLGRNHWEAGCLNVNEMVEKVTDSEDNQLDVMWMFIHSAGLDKCLRDKQWAAFAHGYNGPNYAKNNYDQRLAEAYASFTERGLPDLAIRAMQLRLKFLGYPTNVDGIFGSRTAISLARFVVDQKLPPDWERSHLEERLAEVVAGGAA